MEPSGSGHSAQHDPYHCEMDPRRDALGESLVVADEAPGLHEPAEGPLDHPAPGHDLEARAGVDALHHFHREAGLQLGHVPSEVGAAEPAIHVESLQPRG